MNNLPPIADAVISALLAIGAAFALIGLSVLERLPGLCLGLYSTSKDTTLGVRRDAGWQPRGFGSA